MGSTGGYLPRLEGHCEHKLATSCVLTSTRRCCACEDQRTHSTTYSIYVDGAGLRPWGTRWINYCWPCKEYWDHRTGNGVLPSNITCIPSIPSQSRFLERWNWFYEQYQSRQRLGFSGDFSLSDVQYYQEPWRDVDPGRLPRTREEVLNGAGRSAYEMAIDAQQWNELLAERHRAMGPTVDIDQALDQLLDVESDDEHDDNDGLTAREAHDALLRHVEEAISAHQPPLIQPRGQGQLQSQLRSDLWGERQFQGYSEVATRRLQEWPRRLLSVLSDPDDSQSPSAQRAPQAVASETLSAALDTMQIDAVPLNDRSRSSQHMASSILEDAASSIRRLMAEMHLLDSERSVEQREIDATNTPQDILSSWADRMQQMNDEGGRIIRLHDAASDATLSLVNAWPADLDPAIKQLIEISASCIERCTGLPVSTILRAVGRQSMEEMPRVDDIEPLRTAIAIDEQWSNIVQILELQRLQRDQLKKLIEIAEKHIIFLRERGLLQHSSPVRGLHSGVMRSNKLGLDSTPRPEALRDEQMLVRMECGICLHQIADIACLPCGHAVMCQWCADVHMPLMPDAATALLTSGKPCPKCRKPVKQRVKLYL